MRDSFFLKAIILLIWATAASFAVAAQTESPAAIQTNALPANYRIHQGDKLSVKFLYHPELNETSLQVRPDGFVSLQLIDEIKAENLTILEFKAKLEKAYDEHLLKPVISVALVEFVAPRVFVGGQVGKPGSYELRQGQTLVQVIFLAGGFTRDANRRSVLHARLNNAGEWEFQEANALKILNEKAARKDLALRDGDYVFVPDSKTAQFNKIVESFRGLLPLGFF